MDEKLRASFIPKQPLVGHDVAVPSRRRRSGGASPFFYISMVIMLLALLSWGGVFAWQKIVENSISEKRASLESMREQFRPADIARYKRLDDRIRVAFERLQSHRVIHPLFVLLNESTLPEVQYTSVAFSTEERVQEQPFGNMNEFGEFIPPQPPITEYKINIKAETDSFETISLQSRIFQNIEFLKETRFSNFSLDEETFVVSFEIDALIDPKFISYPEVISRSGQVDLEENNEGVDGTAEADEEGEVEVGEEFGDVESDTEESIPEDNLGEEEVVNNPNE